MRDGLIGRATAGEVEDVAAVGSEAICGWALVDPEIPNNEIPRKVTISGNAMVGQASFEMGDRQMDI